MNNIKFFLHRDFLLLKVYTALGNEELNKFLFVSSTVECALYANCPFCKSMKGDVQLWLMCTITLFVVYGLTIFLHNLMCWTTCSFTITMVRGNVVYIGLLHASKQDEVHIEESSKGKRQLVFALIKKQIVCKVSVR